MTHNLHENKTWYNTDGIKVFTGYNLKISIFNQFDKLAFLVSSVLAY